MNIMELELFSALYKSVVLANKLKISLWMCTYRANTRCLLANNNVSAVSALPDHLAIS